MRVARLFAVAAAVAIAAVPAFAAHHEGEKKAEGMPTPEEMQAYMAAYATPGDEHKVLDYYVGEWNTETKMFMPGMDGKLSKGKATYKWSLDGRYVTGSYDGEFLDAPFKGMDITGYDRAKKQYFNLWFDTMGTGYLLSHGSSPDGKTFTYEGSSFDPMSGGDVTYRMVSTKKSDDVYVFEMYQSGAGMDEAKTLEITYTRAKKKAAAKK